MLTLADVIESEQGIRPDRATLGISEGVVDSRQAIPGSLFVAIKGERSDGHEYVAAAFKNGAGLASQTRHLPFELQIHNKVYKNWLLFGENASIYASSVLPAALANQPPKNWLLRFFPTVTAH
jgi:UDP-N-acetylmuramyl pentapeptide synthase